MRNLRVAALVLPLLAISGATADLGKVPDHEARFLATCQRAHSAQECQRAMGTLQRLLGPEDFVLLVSNAKVLQLVSAAK
jgi:hypothetical protein